MFDNLIDYTTRKLMEMDRKVAAGEELVDYELQCGDLIAHMDKSLRTSRAMAEAESDDGRSMRGGRSRASRYDSMAYADGGMSYRDEGMGRGNSMRGGRRYSRADRMDDVVASVQSAMNDMPADMRREAQNFVNRLQQQM